jgi:glucokinase
VGHGPSASRHLGLDLGGTNIKWVIAEHVPGQGGGIGAAVGATGEWRILDRGQVATPVAGGPDAVVSTLSTVGAAAIGRFPGVTSVGVGIPGLYDPTAGTTRFLVNFPGGWPGVPISGPVGSALGLPATLINDARAFGVAELRLGAARRASSMIGLTLGTGIGGVFAIDGRVHQGHDGTGGEMGHQTLDPDGPPCGCGNRGCLEAFARADRIAGACGTATAEAAFVAARAGDPAAVAGLAVIGRYLGIGIANMIVVVNPDVVVIGGGISAAFDLLRHPIEAELRARVHTTALELVRIVPAELGTWAGSIGAAIHGAETAERTDPATARSSAGAR